MTTVAQEITLVLGNATIGATLAVPDGASALVIFAHGSGSSRLSGRNRYVAQVLQQKKLATLLIDLLERTPEVMRGSRSIEYRISAD